MKKVKISSVSIKTTPLDFHGNFLKIRDAIQSNDSSESSILLFPELCISGYGCEDTFYNPYVWKESLISIKNLLPFSNEKVIIVGLPIFNSPFLYNCSAVIFNQKILGFIPKSHLAGTGIHYEYRWFKGGFKGQEKISIGDDNIPFGNLVFKTNHFSFGVEICEDSWVMEKPSMYYSSAGADIIFSMGASHFSLGKQEIRRNLFKENSRNQNNIHIYSNLNGNESGKIIFEGGCLIYQNGNLLAEGKRLHFKDFEITSAILDIDSISQNRAKSFRSTNQINNFDFIYIPLKLLDTHGNITDYKIPETINRYSDFSSAVSLGLFDYLIKSGANGFSLSLSGGADSSACAILVTIMKLKAKYELGLDIFQKLSLDENDILFSIYQSTINNSEETKIYARTLAESLNIKHFEISIDSQVDSIISSLSKELDINISWKEYDLALQNVQARVRSPIVWMMANLKGHLLISTGNRSEASVGYTTMDGDSSGSLCPISGVSKAFILEWLRFIHDGGDSHLQSLPILKKLLEKPPTAELKPLSENQEDEKELMPYPLLQLIEEQFVYHGRNELEIFEILKERVNFEEEDLKEYINKFCGMFSRAQWKRERLPPGFHLDDYGLDPKTSFRYPILSRKSTSDSD